MNSSTSIRQYEKSLIDESPQIRYNGSSYALYCNPQTVLEQSYKDVAGFTCLCLVAP